jgi:hypothetical protein
MVKNDAVKNAVANAQAAVASAASAGANAAKNPAAVPAIPAATKVQAQVAQTQSQGQSQGQSQVQAQMPAAATAPASGQVAVNNAAAPAGESKPENLAPVANSGLVKSNLVLDLEYVLTPNQPAEQQAKLPANPAEIQEIPLQYSKLVKVNNLEFSNPLYKIIINGEMNSLQDDSMPSGSLSVKVEKVDTLISYLSTGLSQIADQKKPMAATQVQSSNLAGNGMIMEDSYQSFLRRIVAGLSPVAKELAAKNAVSKEDIAQFDIRREKNLEFLINETPMREILGKF